MPDVGPCSYLDVTLSLIPMIHRAVERGVNASLALRKTPQAKICQDSFHESNGSSSMLIFMP